MLTFWLHPELPTCADCQRWVHDPKTWRRVVRRGEVMEREPGEPTPCALCPKAKGDGSKEPNPEADIDWRGLQALDYSYQVQVDPLGHWVPRDRLTLKLCGLIRLLQDRAAGARGDVRALALAIAGGEKKHG